MWCIVLGVARWAQCRKRIKNVDNMDKIFMVLEKCASGKIGGELSLVDPSKRNLLCVDKKM